MGGASPRRWLGQFVRSASFLLRAAGVIYCTREFLVDCILVRVLAGWGNLVVRGQNKSCFVRAAFRRPAEPLLLPCSPELPAPRPAQAPAGRRGTRPPRRTHHLQCDGASMEPTFSAEGNLVLVEQVSRWRERIQVQCQALAARARRAGAGGAGAGAVVFSEASQ